MALCDHVVLALVVVPVIAIGVRKFGRYLRDLSHATQAAAAVAASIAEVGICFCALQSPVMLTASRACFN